MFEGFPVISAADLWFPSFAVRENSLISVGCFILHPRVRSVLVNVQWARQGHVLMCGHADRGVSAGSFWMVVLNSAYFLISCLVALPIVERGVLKSATRTVDLPILPVLSVFPYIFGSPVVGCIYL